MDGKGCWRDNVFVERLWKSIKYEEVYLRAYETVSAARSGIGRYLAFYNSRRPHSALDGSTPDQAYLTSRQPIPAANKADIHSATARDLFKQDGVSKVVEIWVGVISGCDWKTTRGGNRQGDHAVKEDSETSPFALLAEHDAFDPLEGVRLRVRVFIETILEEELQAALGRGRYERPAEVDHRNGHRERQIMGTFGAETVRGAAGADAR